MSLLSVSRTLFSKALMGNVSVRSTMPFRNINQLYPRITPILSSTPLSLNQKAVQVVPSRKSSHGDHVRLWTAEKAFSAALLPIIPTAFIFPSPIMDYLLAFTLTLHSHWGIEAIVVDYVRPQVFGDFIPKLALGLLYAFSALTLGGLCYFTYTDVGLVEAIKMLWKL